MLIYKKIMFRKQKGQKSLYLRSLGFGNISMSIDEDSTAQCVKTYIGRIFQRRAAHVQLLDGNKKLQGNQKVFQIDSLMFIMALQRYQQYPTRKQRIIYPANMARHTKIKSLVEQLNRPIPLSFQQRIIEKILLNQHNGVNEHLGYVKNMVSHWYIMKFAQYLISQTDNTEYYRVQSFPQLLETKMEVLQLAKIMIKWNFQPTQDHIFFSYMKDAGFGHALSAAEWLNIQLNYKIISCAKQPRISMIIQAKFGFDKLFEEKLKQIGYAYLMVKGE